MGQGRLQVTLALLDQRRQLTGQLRGRGQQVVHRLASLIACHTLCGVSGVLSCLMPISLSASITPLVMQGGPPIAPDSPQPFAPSGLVRHGAEGSSVTTIEGISTARGTQ